MELVAKITLLFAGWGATAGVLSGFLRGIPLGDLEGSLVLLTIFFFLFYVSFKLAPNVLKFTPEEFPGGKWTGWTAFRKGFFGFFIMWLVLWIMTHTMLVS